MKFTIATGVYRFLHEILDGMQRTQHRSAWWHSAEDGGIIFICFDAADAQKAHDALEKAGVLSQERLGAVASDGSGRIIEVKHDIH